MNIFKLGERTRFTEQVDGFVVSVKQDRDRVQVTIDCDLSSLGMPIWSAAISAVEHWGDRRKRRSGWLDMGSTAC